MTIDTGIVLVLTYLLVSAIVVFAFLFVVFALFAVLAVDSAYLGTITWFEWLSGKTLQNYFYQIMYLVHLALGLLLVIEHAPTVDSSASPAKHNDRQLIRVVVAR